MRKKTNEDRIKKVADLAETHFGEGEVRFVGIKYEPRTKTFIAKIKLKNFTSFYEMGEDSTIAIKNLKNKLKKAIARYNFI